jgi:hypothetical protein
LRVHTSLSALFSLYVPESVSPLCLQEAGGANVDVGVSIGCVGYGVRVDVGSGVFVGDGGEIVRDEFGVTVGPMAVKDVQDVRTVVINKRRNFPACIA